MFLFSKYQTHIFETDAMVRIVFSLVQTNAVKLDSRRPYIQGEVRLQRVRQKIFDQTSKTETLNTVIQCLDKYFNLYTI